VLILNWLNNAISTHYPLKSLPGKTKAEYAVLIFFARHLGSVALLRSIKASEEYKSLFDKSV